MGYVRDKDEAHLESRRKMIEILLLDPETRDRVGLVYHGSVDDLGASGSPL